LTRTRKELPATYDEVLAIVKTIGNYSIFKNSHARLFQHAADQGWLMYLLPYVSHSQRSYHDAVGIHNRAMDRAQRKEAKQRRN
jgi:hypothetical protein